MAKSKVKATRQSLSQVRDKALGTKKINVRKARSIAEELVTEKMPPVDMVLFSWAGLFLFFIKATIQKDLLNVVTIGFGFFVQASLMALIIFK